MSGTTDTVVANAEVKSATTIIDRRTSIAVASAILLANICNYGFQIATGHLLSVEEYGLLGGFMAGITIITVATSSLQTASARAIAAGEHQARRSGYLDRLTRTAVITAIAVGFIGVVLSPILSRFLNIGILPIVILGLYVLPSSLDSIAAGRLQGSKRFYALAVYSSAQAVGKIVVVAGVFAVGLHVSGLLAGVVLSCAVVAIVGLFSSRDVGAISTHVLSPEMRWNFAALLLFWIIVTSDMAFARAFFEPEAAGVYAAAAVLGRAVLWLPMVLTQVLFPHMADRWARKQAIRTVMTRAFLLIAVIAVVAVGGLYVFGQQIFAILYGDKYDGAADIAWKIGLAMVPLAMLNLLVFHFLARGQRRFLLTMAIATVGELLAFYLVPKSGTYYAAVLGCTGLVLLICVMPRSAWRRAGRIRIPAGASIPPES
jgi:O-antigen/teichoic acid export membrane protein